VGLYVNARKKGATPEQGMNEARDSTIDFGRIGVARSLNQIIAFWNANLQGTDKMARALTNEKTRGKTLLKIAGGITLPTIALWLFNNSDDERKKRYEDLPGWRKIFFWNIPIDGGPIISIPKPFELGLLFGSSFEAVLSHFFSKDPEAMKDLGRSMVDAVTPGLIPTTVLPILETMTNYSFFRGKPIENLGMQSLPPEMRYTPWTPEVFKKAGDMVNVSPAMIQNWVRGWTGTLGSDAASLSDLLVPGEPVKPERTWYEKTPFLKGMISREPVGAGSKYLDLFYKKSKETTQAQRGLKQLMESGERAKAKEFYTDNMTLIRLAPIASRISTELAELSDRKAAIVEHKTMDAARKRQMIEKIDTRMSDLAKRFVTIYEKRRRASS